MDDRFQQIVPRIGSFSRLPSLPHILTRLLEISRNEDASIQDMARILVNDTGLTARVLNIANSSFYRNAEKAASLDAVLMRMGMSAVKNLVLSASVHQAFNGAPAVPGFDFQRYWRHALLTAVLARRIAERTGLNAPEQAFFAGMIHDMGRLILVTNLPDAYAGVLAAADNPNYILDEERLVGIPHTEVGAWLLDRWGMDPMTVDAVLYHHEPAGRIADAFPLVRVVCVANLMAEIPEYRTMPYEKIATIFPFDLKEIDGMVAEAEDEVDALAASMHIAVAGRPATGSAGQDDSASTDEAAAQNLRSSVRDISLMFGVVRELSAAADEDAMLRVIHDGVRTLLDCPEVFVFLYDEPRQVLVNRADPMDSRLVVPLDRRNNLPAKAFLDRSAACSLGGKTVVTILDQQLARLLASDGILCVPLVAGQDRAGVLVLGADDADAAVLEEREGLLNLFAGTVTKILLAERLKREQQRQAASERVAVMTTLSRRVAHEVNNPLGIIKNFLAILASRLNETTGGQKEIAVIREEIDRIARILRELADAAKSTVRERVSFDLNALVSDTLDMMRPFAGPYNPITFACRLDPALPLVSSDRDGVKQVLLNLFKNAVEALSEKGGGTLSAETSLDPTPLPGYDYGKILIRIRDDGPGIPAVIRERLFTPVTSTKAGGHAGIGLSIVATIMHDLGGNIACDSDPGQGTLFLLSLPAAATGNGRAAS